MYYSYPCPVCGKIFYTFNDNQETAAQTIYNGLEQHMQSYGEEDSGYDNIEHPQHLEEDQNTIYSGMSSSSEAPAGGYVLE